MRKVLLLFIATLLAAPAAAQWNNVAIRTETGSATGDSLNIVVTSSGGDGARGVAFELFSRRHTLADGDSIYARPDSLDEIATWRQSLGMILTESGSGVAPALVAEYLPYNQWLIVRKRAVTDASADIDQIIRVRQPCIKVRRDGDSYFLSYSADDDCATATYTALDNLTFVYNAPAVHLFASSYSDADTTTGYFSQVLTPSVDEDDPDPVDPGSTLFPTEEEWQETIVAYLQSLPADSFDVTFGQELTWDGTYESSDQLHELWFAMQEDGDANRAVAPGQRLSSAWYTLGVREADTLLVAKDSYVNQAAATTNYAADAELVVRKAASNSRWSFVEFDISGLTRRPVLASFDIYVTSIGSEDAANVYVGSKVYNDLSWAEGTATWNVLPVDLTTPPAYDDIERVDPDAGTYVRFYLGAAIQSAYDAGANSVTIALYNANAQFNGSSTTRTATFASSESANPPSLALYYNEGMETTDQLRFPDYYQDLYNYSLSRGTAYLTQIDIPLAGDGQGNPYFGDRGFMHRSMVLALARAVYEHTNQGETYGAGMFWGGKLNDITDTYDLIGDLLPANVQQALETWFIEANNQLQNEWTGIPGSQIFDNDNHDYNGNLDMRAIEGAMKTCAFARHYTTTLCAEADSTARAAMYGSRTGTPDNSNHVQGLYLAFGSIDEGDGTETSYAERSLEHIWGGYANIVNRGRKSGMGYNFNHLDTVIRRHGEFVWFQSYIDLDGSANGPSAYASRTHTPHVFGQDTPWQNIGIAAGFYTGRPWSRGFSGNGSIRVPATDAAMVTQMQAWINNVPAPVLLSGIPPTPGNSNGATTGSAGGGGSPWAPPIPIEPTNSAWTSTLRALDGDPSTFPYPANVRDTTFIKKFEAYPYTGGTPEPYFTAVRSCVPGGRCWAAFLEHAWYGGFNNHMGGGTVNAFWDDEVGISMMGFTKQASESGDSLYYSDNYLLENVFATDENGSGISFTGMDGSWDPASPYARTITRSNADSTITVITPADWSLTTSRNDGYSISSSKGWLQTVGSITVGKQLTRKRTMEIEPDGLLLTDTVSYDPMGTDEIKTFTYQAPLYCKSSSQSEVQCNVYYWTGAAWDIIPAGGTAVGQHFRFGRDMDGPGLLYDEVFTWHELDEPRPVVVKQVTTAGSGNNGYLLVVDLHPNSGTAVIFPETTAWSHRIAVTDPGFIATEAGVALVYPEPTDELPAGGTLYGQFQVLAPEGRTIDGVDYYTLTEGGSWMLAGAATNSSGLLWHWVGNTIPAGLDSIGVEVEDDIGQLTWRQWNVASSSLQRVAYDQFTAADATSLTTGRTSDENTTGGAWTKHGTGTLQVSSNRATSTSGTGGLYLNHGTGKKDVLVRAVVRRTVTGANDAAVGLVTRRTSSGAGYVRTTLHSTGGVQLVWRNGNNGNTATSLGSYTVVNGTDYMVENQLVGRVAISNLYDATGATLHTRAFYFGVDTGVVDARHGWHIGGSNGQYVDNYEAYEW